MDAWGDRTPNQGADDTLTSGKYVEWDGRLIVAIPTVPRKAANYLDDTVASFIDAAQGVEGGAFTHVHVVVLSHVGRELKRRRRLKIGLPKRRRLKVRCCCSCSCSCCCVCCSC